jgi:hypothetical protein
MPAKSLSLTSLDVETPPHNERVLATTGRSERRKRNKDAIAREQQTARICLISPGTS